MTKTFRYKKLGYVALNVTDVERSADYYENMVDLSYVGAGNDGQRFLRCSYDHHNIVLYPGKVPGLKRIGWELEDDDNLEKAFEVVTKLGLNPIEISMEERADLKQGRSFRFRVPPIGIEFEFYSSIMQMAAPYQPQKAQIQRLGHVVIHVADIQNSLRFLSENLNFAISDSFGLGFYFLRCWPNPYHHSFAIAQGPENSLNHVNFMCSHLDDIGRGISRFKKNDVTVINGPGRHPPSGSFFLYWLDPDGMTVEYSCGMEEFPEAGARKPRMMEPVMESLDYWGGSPILDYRPKGEIEGAFRPNEASAAE